MNALDRVQGQPSAQRLAPEYTEKPWGRCNLPALFPNPANRRIGEIAFQGNETPPLPLLVKYIFTSERLSIQVHPGDRQAHDAGLPSGKEECWYILDCEPGAVLGIGLKEKANEEQIRAAAIDGSLVDRIDWKPVEPGQFYFIPAGTIHAIGAGISLVEIQQNVDVTYRLFDYGRPRALHLDEAMIASTFAPYARETVCAGPLDNQQLLSASEAPFWVEHVSWPDADAVILPDRSPFWFIPLSGSGTIDGIPWKRGECWWMAPDSSIGIDQATHALLAAPR
jgi:mannose-6-phosphate isomerase